MERLERWCWDITEIYEQYMMNYQLLAMEEIMTTENSRLIKYIGIDPGKSGGIAVISDERIEVKKCPASVYDMALMFELIIHGSPPNDVIVMIEKVWARPHDGRSSVFTFAQNYGHWEGIIASHEIQSHHVTPQVWMKALGCPPRLKKQERKNYLKELAKKKYPELGKKIILATADAILLANYLKENKKT